MTATVIQKLKLDAGSGNEIDPGSDYHAEKPVTGRSWDCIHGTKASAAGYPHLYYWSNPKFAARFLDEAEKYLLTR